MPRNIRIAEKVRVPHQYPRNEQLQEVSLECVNPERHGCILSLVNSKSFNLVISYKLRSVESVSNTSC